MLELVEVEQMNHVEQMKKSQRISAFRHLLGREVANIELNTLFFQSKSQSSFLHNMIGQKPPKIYDFGWED